ncbi:hypothetical protein HK102_005424 [Quaeritorhiza haematococci]|nr:hypothetical protein HK102_005424 [Quaeritorhiza haematococci]
MNSHWKPVLRQAIATNAKSHLSVDGRPSCRTLAFRAFVEDLIPVLSTDISNPDKTPNDEGKQEVSSMLVFAVDARSAKISEISKNNGGELCFYFPETREQMRLRCNLHLVLSPLQTTPTTNTVLRPITPLPPHGGTDWEELRLRLWSQLSPKARAQFVWPQPKAPRHQSTDIEDGKLKETTTGWVETLDEQDVSMEEARQTALSNFALLLAEVESMDHLRLMDHPNRRILYNRRKSKGEGKGMTEGSEWDVVEVNP